MGSRGANGVVDKGVDFANYFCTYGFLYHQKEMLCDRVRMDAYYNAIFQNKHHFQGKAVLDVGTGSGILAIWSAQAGARKVYAVEATKMAEHARELAKANKLQDIVEVIEGSMEDVTLPEKVDVIISEWMGYFLLRESMLDSVIYARDHWLKPDGVMWMPTGGAHFILKEHKIYTFGSEIGVPTLITYDATCDSEFSMYDEHLQAHILSEMHKVKDLSVECLKIYDFAVAAGHSYVSISKSAHYYPYMLGLRIRVAAVESYKYPSHARMWMAPIRSGLADQKMSDYEGAMEDWYNFVDETKANYGVDMRVLTNPFIEEQGKYYLQTSIWNSLHPNQIIGTPVTIKELDCLTTTINDICDVRSSSSLSITAENSRLCGFGGWFDVHFRGSNKNRAQQEVELTTAPSIDSLTHWGQQVFLLHPPQRVQSGDDIILHFSMNRSKDNHRLMDVDLGCEIRQSSGNLLPPFRKKFYIE